MDRPDDEAEWSAADRPPRGAPAQWGLAAVVSAVGIGLAFPIALLLIAAGAGAYFASPDWPRDGLVAATWITAVALVGLLLLAVVVLGYGILGLVLARRRREPVGLALAGLLGGIAAVFFSTLLAVSAGLIGAEMWKEQDRRDREKLAPRPVQKKAAW